MVITTKYISASLVTVSRMLDPFIPRYFDLKTWAWMMTRAKTTMSVGTARWVQCKEWKD